MVEGDIEAFDVISRGKNAVAAVDIGVRVGRKEAADNALVGRASADIKGEVFAAHIEANVHIAGATAEGCTCNVRELADEEAIKGFAVDLSFYDAIGNIVTDRFPNQRFGDASTCKFLFLAIDFELVVFNIDREVVDIGVVGFAPVEFYVIEDVGVVVEKRPANGARVGGRGNKNACIIDSFGAAVVGLPCAIACDFEAIGGIIEQWATGFIEDIGRLGENTCIFWVAFERAIDANQVSEEIAVLVEFCGDIALGEVDRIGVLGDLSSVSIWGKECFFDADISSGVLAFEDTIDDRDFFPLANNIDFIGAGREGDGKGGGSGEAAEK